MYLEEREGPVEQEGKVRGLPEPLGDELQQPWCQVCGEGPGEQRQPLRRGGGGLQGLEHDGLLVQLSVCASWCIASSAYVQSSTQIV